MDAPEYAESLERIGPSGQTVHRWQQLSEVPAAQFEAALADPVERPATNGLLAKQREAASLILAGIFTAAWVGRR